MNTFAKKVVILGGVAGLMCLAAFGGMLVMAQQSGDTAQEKFFQAIASDQPDQVTRQCHPALLEEIDKPVLAAWMQAINKYLGDYEGLSSTDFTTSVRIENGEFVFESKGEVLFERGTAQSELVFIAGKLTRFNIDTKALPVDWFTQPAESNLFQDQSREFLETFLQGSGDKTRKRMHSELQKMVSDEAFNVQLEWVKSYAGEIKCIKYLSEQMEMKGDEQRLTVRFLAEGTEANLEATVTFQFAGLKGHLVAYHWKPTDHS